LPLFDPNPSDDYLDDDEDESDEDDGFLLY